jgi:hypothetical protein
MKVETGRRKVKLYESSLFLNPGLICLIEVVAGATQFVFRFSFNGHEADFS